MKKLLREIFTSKKALAALAALLTLALDRAGVNLDPPTVDRVLAILGAYVVGQGLADIGKEARKKGGELVSAGLEAGKEAGMRVIRDIIWRDTPTETEAQAKIVEAADRLEVEATKALLRQKRIDAIELDPSKAHPDVFKPRSKEWFAQRREAEKAGQ